ncbi:hypothetical protein JQ597_25410 [Bradyrhizobium sp. AUGA SZCCT0177]|uniref:hypothetical protein n=1 Tax=Bradyrhizobium sp. AUGA SZCCT0177 TaxID=2807665 RepID=UPI001BAA6961|nr:hypothetical protein [Bradyrhizobium sp. AUGA SZCCT0177]MBR1285393.1 hypothetical protein [Bradyrhizobium sp. AUGA SZCCT0177]
MDRTASISWFVKASAACVAVLAMCWIAPQFLKDIPDFPATTTDEIQSRIADRYLNSPVAPVALTGSSFTVRLHEEFFHKLYVRNLALPGGSPLTGAAMIEAATAVRPRLIAIETNTLSRGIDQAMVERVRTSNAEPARAPMNFRPLRTLAALYQQKLDDWQRFDRDDKSALLRQSALEEAILRKPPAPEYNPHVLAAVLAEWNNPDHDQIIRRHAAELKHIVETLEMQKISVFFYELPLSPAFARSRYMTTGRSAMAEAFGHDHGRWLSLDYPSNEIRWTDGAHLDERSAIIMARSLERAIARKIGSEVVKQTSSDLAR